MINENEQTYKQKMRFIFTINYAHTDLDSSHIRCVNISISSEQKKNRKQSRMSLTKTSQLLGYAHVSLERELITENRSERVNFNPIIAQKHSYTKISHINI